MITSTNAPRKWENFHIFYVPLHHWKYKLFVGEQIVYCLYIAENIYIYLFRFREILLRFSIAYHSRIFTVPIDWLETVLACRDQSEVIRLCKYYNINCDAEERCVRFIRADFNERAPIVIVNFPLRDQEIYSNVSQFQMKSSHEYFVDKKLQNLQITDILDNEHILPN